MSEMTPDAMAVKVFVGSGAMAATAASILLDAGHTAEEVTSTIREIMPRFVDATVVLFEDPTPIPLNKAKGWLKKAAHEVLVNSGIIHTAPPADA